MGSGEYDPAIATWGPHKITNGVIATTQLKKRNVNKFMRPNCPSSSGLDSGNPSRHQMTRPMRSAPPPKMIEYQQTNARIRGDSIRNPSLAIRPPWRGAAPRMRRLRDLRELKPAPAQGELGRARLPPKRAGALLGWVHATAASRLRNMPDLCFQPADNICRVEHFTQSGGRSKYREDIMERSRVRSIRPRGRCGSRSALFNSLTSDSSRSGSG